MEKSAKLGFDFIWYSNVLLYRGSLHSKKVLHTHKSHLWNQLFKEPFKRFCNDSFAKEAAGGLVVRNLHLQSEGYEFES